MPAGAPDPLIRISIGFAVRILPRATEGGGWRYELRLGGYADAAEADAAAAVLHAMTGLKPVVTP